MCSSDSIRPRGVLLLLLALAVVAVLLDGGHCVAATDAAGHTAFSAEEPGHDEHCLTPANTVLIGPAAAAPELSVPSAVAIAPGTYRRCASMPGFVAAVARPPLLAALGVSRT